VDMEEKEESDVNTIAHARASINPKYVGVYQVLATGASPRYRSWVPWIRMLIGLVLRVLSLIRPRAPLRCTGGTAALRQRGRGGRGAGECGSFTSWSAAGEEVRCSDVWLLTLMRLI
jgi:hypothetical protein